MTKVKETLITHLSLRPTPFRRAGEMSQVWSTGVGIQETLLSGKVSTL